VLFDVGGPINTEVEHERLIDADIVAALRAEGVELDEARYADACAWAVEHFAPDAHTAIIWRLAQGDRAVAERAHARMMAVAHGRNPFELRGGIVDVIRWLHAGKLALGLAANQPSGTIAVLDAHGVGQFFGHREVSGTHGFKKPDVRLFLRCCDDLRVRAEECIMVGDRIDNDVAPARVLGMRTVLFRTGRHMAQQPRCAAEVPDAEVRNTAELRTALERMLGLDASGGGDREPARE
jgi:HAD superfamily hydrolase (TIGR01549 family)